MRRAQKTNKWQRKQTVDNRGLWFPVAPVMYGCEPAPVKVLPHKFERILKRLAKGGHFIRSGYATNRRIYVWITAGQTASAIRAKVVDALVALGYIAQASDTWLITSIGLAAIGLPVRDDAQKLAIAAARLAA